MGCCRVDGRRGRGIRGGRGGRKERGGRKGGKESVIGQWVNDGADGADNRSLSLKTLLSPSMFVCLLSMCLSSENEIDFSMG